MLVNSMTFYQYSRKQYFEMYPVLKQNKYSDTLVVLFFQQRLSEIYLQHLLQRILWCFKKKYFVTVSIKESKTNLKVI